MQVLAPWIGAVADDGGADPSKLAACSNEPVVLLHPLAKQITDEGRHRGVFFGGPNSSPTDHVLFERDRHVSQPPHDTIIVLHESRVKWVEKNRNARRSDERLTAGFPPARPSRRAA